MIETDTPETDAHAMDWHRQGMVSTDGGSWVGVYLARNLERQRDAERKKNARILSAVQILADQDFGSQGWNFACEQAAMTLRHLLKNQ